MLGGEDLTENIIEFHNVNYKYPEAESAAVKDLSFSVKKGQWFTILGHNGSGKSTVTRLMAGLLSGSTNSEVGTINVNGQRLTSETVWNIRNQIGIVFQNPDNQFVGATVADDVAFGLENRVVPRDQIVKLVNSALAEVGMSEYEGAEPANLSGGQKQRVAIAGILAVKPKIIVLDESTSMLDPKGRQNILALVRKMQKQEDLTVISITHDVEEAEFADQIMLLNDGKKIFQGRPEQVFKNAELIKKAHLELPFIYQLRSSLKKAGITLDDQLDSREKVISALCQLNSKK